MPLISIILPTYNRIELLPYAIESVLRQSLKDFELIIINDASNDSTKEYLNSLKDDRIIIINNQKNLRLQKSLNKGLDSSNGKYIARIDDDDVWDDIDKLSKQLTFLEMNPDVALLGTAYEISGKKFYTPQTDKAIRKQMLFRCPFQHSTVIFKREINGAQIKYDDALSLCEDWDLWALLGTRGKLANLSESTTIINETEDSITKNNFYGHLVANRKLSSKYSRSYPNSILATIYHSFVSIFFKFIPINSSIHILFQRIFAKTFQSK